MDLLPMAVLIQMTANVNRDTKARSYPFELEEVLGWLGIAPEAEPAPPPAPATPEELRAKLGLLAEMYPKPNGQQDGG